MEQPGRRASPRPHRPRCRRSTAHRPWFSVLGSSGTRSPRTRGSRSSLRRRTCWRTRPWHRAYLLFFFSVFFCAPSDLACRDHSFFFFFRGGGSAAQASELTNLVQKEIDKRHPDGSGSNTGHHQQLSLRQKKQLEQINQALHTNQLDIRSPLGQAFSRAIASSEEASSFQKKKRKPLGNALNDARMLSSGRQEGFLNYLSGTRAMPGRPTSTRSCRRRRRQSTGWSGHAANRRSRSFSCGLCRCLLFSPRRTSSTASGMSETSCFS